MRDCVIDSRRRVSNHSPMKKTLLSLAAIALLLASLGIALPPRTVVERSILIDAYPATVFALLNDFNQVAQWLPMLDADANAQIDISGPQRGIGARIAWNGPIIGQGQQTIVESVPYERIATALNPGKRSPASNVFSLSPENGMTRLSWRQEREFGLQLAARFYGLVLERVVGPEQERGLVELQRLAENLPRADFSDIEIEQLVVQPQDIAYLQTTSIPQATAISEAMRDAYYRVLGFIDELGLEEAGAPLSITRTFSGAELVFDAAIPVRGVATDMPQSTGAVSMSETYGGPVIRVRHIGAYGALSVTHEKIAAYLAALGITRDGDAWESYVSDPTRTDEALLLTYVYYPVRP